MHHYTRLLLNIYLNTVLDHLLRTPQILPHPSLVSAIVLSCVSVNKHKADSFSEILV